MKDIRRVPWAQTVTVCTEPCPWLCTAQRNTKVIFMWELPCRLAVIQEHTISTVQCSCLKIFQFSPQTTISYCAIPFATGRMQNWYTCLLSVKRWDCQSNLTARQVSYNCQQAPTHHMPVVYKINYPSTQLVNWCTRHLLLLQSTDVCYSSLLRFCCYCSMSNSFYNAARVTVATKSYVPLLLFFSNPKTFDG